MLEFFSLFLDHLWSKVKKVSCLALPVLLFVLSLLTVLVNEQPILREIMKYSKLKLNLFYI